MPELARAIAGVFDVGLRQRLHEVEKADLPTSGLESVLVNDVAVSVKWETLAAWKGSGCTHINLLESGAFYRLCRRKARGGGPSRFVNLIDRMCPGAP